MSSLSKKNSNQTAKVDKNQIQKYVSRTKSFDMLRK
jgi:hypothetical protein